jgi:hypothetical protein
MRINQGGTAEFETRPYCTSLLCCEGGFSYYPQSEAEMQPDALSLAQELDALPNSEKSRERVRTIALLYTRRFFLKNLKPDVLERFRNSFLYAITRLKKDQEAFILSMWRRRLNPEYDAWGVAMTLLPLTRTQKCVRFAWRTRDFIRWQLRTRIVQACAAAKQLTIVGNSMEPEGQAA